MDDSDDPLQRKWSPPGDCPLNLDEETASLVTDPDQEIFEIYSLQASHRDEDPELRASGLGFLDSRQDVMHLEFELIKGAGSRASSPGLETPSPASATGDTHGASTTEGEERSKRPLELNGRAIKAHLSRRSHHRPVKKVDVGTSKTVEAQIAQDLASLRNRRGDTGSVVWRASVHLAERLLQQHHFPPSTSVPLLNPLVAQESSILELGAGTGLLPIFLSKLFDSWTVTDQFDNLKLIERNLRLNSVRGVLIEEVDWVEVAARPIRKAGGHPSKGVHSLGHIPGVPTRGVGTRNDHDHQGEDKKTFDLVLAVDCVYNEALVKPLVATLNEYASPGKTVVWILAELRSADVLLAFLEEWMTDPTWTIVRLTPTAMGDKLKRSFVSWVGWKEL